MPWTVTVTVPVPPAYEVTLTLHLPVPPPTAPAAAADDGCAPTAATDAAIDDAVRRAVEAHGLPVHLCPAIVATVCALRQHVQHHRAVSAPEIGTAGDVAGCQCVPV